MKTEQLAVVQGWADTRGALRRWNARPSVVLRPWALASLAVGALLLAATWAIASLSTPDPSGATFPGVTERATLGDYGFGLAAHSFLGAERFANTRDLRRYIERSPDARDFSEHLGTDESRRETIFLGLRQTSGILYEDLVRLCGQEGIEWTERGTQDGWLRRVNGRVAFTPAGFLQSNDFISQLF